MTTCIALLFKPRTHKLTIMSSSSTTLFAVLKHVLYNMTTAIHMHVNMHLFLHVITSLHVITYLISSYAYFINDTQEQHWTTR